jgi:hypothetical protein
VFGVGGDYTGVIDLSDVVLKGSDGHPTFESMKAESEALLTDFHAAVLGNGDL